MEKRDWNMKALWLMLAPSVFHLSWSQRIITGLKIQCRKKKIKKIDNLPLRKTRRRNLRYLVWIIIKIARSIEVKITVRTKIYKEKMIKIA